MDPDKFIEMQHQMRLNNFELQDFIRGVDSWQKEVKSKETSKSKDQQQINSDRQLPPVRGCSQLGQTSGVQANKKLESSAKTDRISGYDYRSWDKFDVDKALQDAEEGNGISPSQAVVQPDRVSSLPNLQNDSEEKAVSLSASSSAESKQVGPKLSDSQRQSLVQKEAGNDFMKRGLFERAVESYSQAIQLDSESAVLYANRAAAYLKVGDFEKAEMDCSAAIRLDGAYSKAFYRRACARRALKRYNAAIDDLQTVAMLEPSDRNVQREIETLREVTDLDRPGLVLPIVKPASSASKKPLRRIPVTEVSTASVSIGKPQSNFHSAPVFNRVGSANDRSGEKLSHPVPNPASTVTPGLVTASNGNSTSTKKVDSVENFASREPPATLFQLISETREFRAREPRRFYAYFSRLLPTSLVRFFGDSLETDLLSCILTACFSEAQELCTSASNDEQSRARSTALYIAQTLYELSKVKRFATVALFLGAKEKALVREMCTIISRYEFASGELQNGAIEVIKKAYV